MLWNEDEQRPRLFWRLVFFVTVFVVLLVVLGVVASPLPALVRTFGSLLVAHVGSVWLAGRLVDRRPISDFGLWHDRADWLDFAFGLGLGVGLMAAVFGLQWALGWIEVAGTFVSDDGSFAADLLAGVVVFVAVGFYEELAFRGYLLTNLAEGFNLPRVSPRLALVVAWVVSSALFGVAHGLNPSASLVSTINITLAGLFLGLGFLLTGRLALPVGLHISWNFAQGNLFGFPVSGNPVEGRVFDIVQGGPPVWTGAAFGPEAGLVGLLAMLAGSLATIGWLRLRRGRLSLRSAIAVYAPSSPSLPVQP